MTSMFDRDDIQFQAVVNHEKQYSIWPEYKEIPQDWRIVGKNDLKEDCLAYIEEVWIDMCPLSLRQHMNKAAGWVGGTSVRLFCLPYPDASAMTYSR